MKDNRFIELINLYVDHHLTPAEARELEAELHASPARRRTYQQYCRMQKACAQLFETERASAPATPRLARALSEADRKITRPRESRSTLASWRNIFALGGLAATAACVAVVFALRDPAPQTHPDTPSPTVAAAAQVEPGTTTVALADVTATPDATDAMSAAPATFTFQTPLKRLRLPVITSFASTADNTLRTNAPAIAETMFAWTKELPLRPIRKVSIEDAISGLRRYEKQQIGATLFRMTGSQTQEDVTEMTVIEFKR